MAKPKCSIDDCGSLVQANGYCIKHNWRFKKYGDPLKTVRIFGDDVARFWSKVDKNGPLPERRPELGPCWVWTGSTVRGYGSFRIERGTRSVGAHRWGYKQFVGPVPDELHIDHLCRNHSCVRPDHLEPVTPAENWRRGESPGRMVVVTNLCYRGHSMDDAYVNPNGTRYCRTCRLEKESQYRRDPNSSRHRLNQKRKYRQFTTEQVEEIKRFVATSKTQQAAAEYFGCSQPTISAIVNGHRAGIQPLA